MHSAAFALSWSALGSLLPLDILLRQCSPDCQDHVDLQVEAVLLPSAPALGYFGAACSELCQAVLDGISAVADEPAGVALKQSVAFA